MVMILTAWIHKDKQNMTTGLTVKLDMRYKVRVRWNGVHTLSLPQVPNHHLLILAAGGHAISETQAMFPPKL